MTRPANILSFDEVKARETASPRTVRPSSHPAYRPHGSAPRHASSARSSERFAQADSASSRNRSHARAHSFEGTRSERTVDDDPRRASSSRARHRTQNQGFAKEIRKRFRTAKADRAFEKAIGARERATAEDQTSRPALYEMRMGASQRKSTRMQNEGKERATRGSVLSLPLSILSSLSSHATGLVVTVAAVVFACVMLYPSCASLYNETRQLQQLQAEYDALESYNQQMQGKIDYLNTDEGIEDYARSELGWMRSGETMVSVEGVEASPSDEGETHHVF